MQAFDAGRTFQFAELDAPARLLGLSAPADFDFGVIGDGIARPQLEGMPTRS